MTSLSPLAIPTQSAGPRTPRSRHPRLRLALVVLDAMAMALGVGVGDGARAFVEPYLQMTSIQSDRHAIASVLVIPILLVVLSFRGLYDLDRILSGTREYAEIATSVTFGCFLAVL